MGMTMHCPHCGFSGNENLFATLRPDGDFNFICPKCDQNICGGYSVKNEISNANRHLTASIEDEQLTIRIGVNRINGNDGHPEIPCLTFDNRIQWVRDVINEMLNEKEDGSCPLSDMIDACMIEAMEQGSIGLAEDSMIQVGLCSQCEEDQVDLRFHTDGKFWCRECLEKV